MKEDKLPFEAENFVSVKGGHVRRDTDMSESARGGTAFERRATAFLQTLGKGFGAAQNVDDSLA